MKNLKEIWNNAVNTGKEIRKKWKKTIMIAWIAGSILTGLQSCGWKSPEQIKKKQNITNAIDSIYNNKQIANIFLNLQELTSKGEPIILEDKKDKNGNVINCYIYERNDMIKDNGNSTYRYTEKTQNWEKSLDIHMIAGGVVYFDGKNDFTAEETLEIFRIVWNINHQNQVQRYNPQSEKHEDVEIIGMGDVPIEDTIPEDITPKSGISYTEKASKNK